MAFSLNEYSELMNRYKEAVNAAYPEQGFAFDGPVDSVKWFSGKLESRILFLLKEAYWPADECQRCDIMDNPNRFNDSKTNTTISKMMYAIDEVREKIISSSNEDLENDLFRHIDSVYDRIGQIPKEDLRESFKNIAVVEIKKIAGNSNSTNGDIEKHGSEFKSFLSDQISILNPNIIVCCGPVSWKVLTDYIRPFCDMKNENSDNAIIHYGAVSVVKIYHPLVYRFELVRLCFRLGQALP